MDFKQPEEEGARSLDTLHDDAWTDYPILFHSSDGKTFRLPYALASISKLVCNAMEHEADKENGINIHLDFPSHIVSYAVNYMTYKKGDTSTPPIERPIKDKNMSDLTTEENAVFIDSIWSTDKDHLIKLTLLANYLDVPCLLELACARIAITIRGATPDEIRTMYGKVDGETINEEVANIPE